MNSTILDTFFHYASKAIIAIPIAILIIAVVMKGSQNKTDMITIPSITPSPIYTITQTPSKPNLLLKLKESTIAAQLTLKDNFHCILNENNSKIQFSVLNKQVYVDYKSSKINQSGVFQKDCFYSWDNMTKKGVKICNLGSIVMFIENTPFSNLFSNQIVAPFIKGREGEVLKVVETCRKTNAGNQSLFYVPTNITFSDK